MGVQLNIKDPETVRLARELAGKTGRSVTQTIRTALEQAMAEQADERAVRRVAIDAAARRVRELLPANVQGKSSRELMDAIYDDDGLPR